MSPWAALHVSSPGQGASQASASRACGSPRALVMQASSVALHFVTRVSRDSFLPSNCADDSRLMSKIRDAIHSHGVPSRHRSLNEVGDTLIDRIALPKEVCESRQTGYRHCPSISDVAPLHWMGAGSIGTGSLVRLTIVPTADSSTNGTNPLQSGEPSPRNFIKC